MFDFGLAEFLLIAVVGILVIGPKELPVIMVQVGRVFKRLNYMRFALSRQFESFMAEAGLDDVKDQVNFEAVSDELSPEEVHKAALIEKPVVKKAKAAPKKKAASKAKAKTVTKKKPAAKKAVKKTARKTVKKKEIKDDK